MQDRFLFLRFEDKSEHVPICPAYDKSTIIVMGDHGKLYDGCVFIKLPNEAHNEMQINNKPGVYDDFQATILDMIRAQNCDSFGNSWLE